MSSTYLLAVSNQSLGETEGCPWLGGLENREKTFEDFQKSFEKAKSGGFSELLFPMNSLNWKPFEVALIFLSAQGMKSRLRVHPHLFDCFRDRIQVLQRNLQLSIEWVLDPQYDSNSLDALRLSNPSDRCVVVLRKKHGFIDFLQKVRKTCSLVPSLYCPVPGSSNTDLHSGEIAEIVSSGGPFAGLPYEVFDSRIDSEMDLEPYLDPLFEKKPSGPVEASIVIPVYNNLEYLKAVARHLLAQDHKSFEIVIVDDGSSDNCKQYSESLIKESTGPIGIKYLHFSRSRPRKMGDRQFRAGVARNLGVKHAYGDHLIFLDSDILVPPSFVRTQLSLHKSFDVVQGVRMDLKKDVSSERTNYEMIEPAWHLEPFETDYWHAFQSAPDWESLPFFWKYTCTYALSLQKSLFQSAGRFRRTFFCYGFEDVDLGYRLSKRACRFGINRQFLFHLHHKPERSEFRKSAFLRRKLLETTAEIFFHNNPDPEIYSHFRTYLSGHRPSTTLGGPQ